MREPMRRIVTFNNVSADGYFAGIDGGLDWVVQDPELDKFVMKNSPESRLPKAAEVAELFKVLGDPTRIEILRLLDTNPEVACVTFDDVLPASKSNVSYHLKALRTADINIVALHNHMVGETPAIYFTHFWGKGKAEDLAKGIAAAIKAQADVSKKDVRTGANAETENFDKTTVGQLPKNWLAGCWRARVQSLLGSGGLSDVSKSCRIY